MDDDGGEAAVSVDGAFPGLVEDPGLPDAVDDGAGLAL